MKKDKKTALVAGATGLVGGHIIRLLAQHPEYERVIALVRKPSQLDWAKLPKVEQLKVNYDDLKKGITDIQVDDVFCALGTTAKKTPDKNDYYRIDVEYPFQIAQAAQTCGARHYALVSAHGANARSFSHYLKLKGELENRLKDLGYASLTIARPGLLKGDRQEFRLGERLAEVVTNRLPGNYKAIEAFDVAAALISQTCALEAGTKVLSSSTMQRAKKRLLDEIANNL